MIIDDNPHNKVKWQANEFAENFLQNKAKAALPIKYALSSAFENGHKVGRENIRQVRLENTYLKELLSEIIPEEKLASFIQSRFNEIKYNKKISEIQVDIAALQSKKSKLGVQISAGQKRRRKMTELYKSEMASKLK